jgi:hypothetical protein
MDATFHTSRRGVLRNIKFSGPGRLRFVVAKRPPVGGGAPVERPRLTA